MSSPANARPKSSESSGPRIALWVVIVLTLALLVWMSVFTAQHNPYLSDVGRNKISRSAFIEQCKVSADEFVTKIGQSRNAVFDTEYDPRSLVSGAVSNPQAPGWLLSTQIMISTVGMPSQPVPLLCQSDASGKVSTQVGGGGGQPQQ